jgi:hypothetical protein
VSRPLMLMEGIAVVNVVVINYSQGRLVRKDGEIYIE